MVTKAFDDGGIKFDFVVNLAGETKYGQTEEVISLTFVIDSFRRYIRRISLMFLLLAERPPLRGVLSASLRFPLLKFMTLER
jgi:hypothetical protein